MNHRNSGNVLFADGSVRILRAGIDINILVGLVTKGGGEVVDSTKY